MKTQNFTATACAVALLLFSHPVRAELSENVYFTGSFKCSSNEFATNWNISKGLAGEVGATVYYQQVGYSQVEWLDLSERKGPNGFELLDSNGNPRLHAVVDGETIHASWTAGSPGSDCTSFSISRSESPKHRFDNLFALMEVPEPGDEIAAKVADFTRLPPIIYALPELDRQSYMQRFNDLTNEFWVRYRESLARDIASRPLSTEEDRTAFAQRLGAALSNPKQFKLGRDGFAITFAIMQQAADRYAGSGGMPAKELYVGDALACQRLQEILKADPYYKFSKLELAVGVPSDHWTRPLAENLLSGLRTCEDVPQDYARILTQTWPDLQKKQQLVSTLLQEQSRLLSLPLTMDTLVETKNLQPDEEVVQSVPRGASYYKRFFGSALDARRDDLLNATLASVTEASASSSIDNSDVVKTVFEACEILDNLSGVTGDRREMVRQVCKTANTTLADRQSEQAITQIDAAFLAATRDSTAEEAAEELCKRLPSTLSRQAAGRVYEACSNAQTVLAEKKDAIKCEQAVVSSGASSQLLESTVEVKKTGGSANVSIKDLICNAARGNAQLSFPSKGILAWKTQLMEMRLTGQRKREEVLQLVLNLAESDADWVVGIEDESSKAILAKDGVSVDVLTACIMRTAACRP